MLSYTQCYLSGLELTGTYFRIKWNIIFKRRLEQVIELMERRDDPYKAGGTAWHLWKAEIHCKFSKTEGNGYSLPWQSWHELDWPSNMLLYIQKEKVVL